MNTESLEMRVFEALKSRNAWLATVESCTGGQIANRVTDVAGSSQVFWGGYVAYSNSAKELALGVPAAFIEAHGAVSAEVARALAEGGLARMEDAIRNESLASAPRPLFCVSTTGVAGPGGGTPEKPVGLCYVGLAGWDPTQGPFSRVLRVQTHGDRATCRRFFADRALEELLAATAGTP